MNAKKKIEAKWSIGLGIAMFMGLANVTVLHGMNKEFFQEFKALFPELQQKIQALAMDDAIMFLAQQPITLEGHTDLVNAVAIAGGPTSLELRRAGKVGTGSYDKTAKIWNLNTGELLHTLVGHDRTVNAVAIAGDKVVTGSDDRTAKVWNLNTGELLHTLAGPNGHTGSVEAVAIAGDRVVTGSNDRTAKIWNLNTGELLHTLEGHTGFVRSVAIAGDKVVTGSWDNTAKIWNLEPFAGTPDTNPLLWIIHKATVPQLDVIKRAYEATIAKKEFILVIPSEDAKVFLSLPMQVKQYLLARLNIRR